MPESLWVVIVKEVIGTGSVGVPRITLFEKVKPLGNTGEMDAKPVLVQVAFISTPTVAIILLDPQTIVALDTRDELFS